VYHAALVAKPFGKDSLNKGMNILRAFVDKQLSRFKFPRNIAKLGVNPRRGLCRDDPLLPKHDNVGAASPYIVEGKPPVNGEGSLKSKGRGVRLFRKPARPQNSPGAFRRPSARPAPGFFFTAGIFPDSHFALQIKEKNKITAKANKT
jgi:hypothetical protein